MWSDDYQIGSDWDINSGGRTAALRKLKKVHRKQSDIISLIGLISTANIMLFGWEANVASHLIKEKSIAIISPAIVVKGEMFFSCILLYLRSCITYRAERNTNTSVSHFLKRVKILTGTKDEVYLWSHRVVWNNGAPWCCTKWRQPSVFSKCILVRLALWPAGPRAGKQKSTHQTTHVCTCQCAHMHAHMREPWSNTKGPLCSSYSQPDLALPGPP